MGALGLARPWRPPQPRDDLDYIRRWQPPQPRGPESIEAAERAACHTSRLVLLFAAGFFLGLLVAIPEMVEVQQPMVNVASLSLSLSSTTSTPSVVSGNWSVTLSVRNPNRWSQIAWDHAQVMLLYPNEFVAGMFLEPLSVDTIGNVTLETDTVAFHREVGDLAAEAMRMDSEGDGVMELELIILHNRGGLHHWFSWSGFDCRGLKVGFSSQNQSRVGLLLSDSPNECSHF